MHDYAYMYTSVYDVCVCICVCATTCYMMVAISGNCDCMLLASVTTNVCHYNRRACMYSRHQQSQLTMGVMHDHHKCCCSCSSCIMHYTHAVYVCVCGVVI